MRKKIEVIGVGHHPFSKKYEFNGYSDKETPCLIATDYKAPKTVLELHYYTDEEETEGERNLTKTNEVFNGKPFKYVSLFSGIGGFETALNKLGGTCVLTSEIDRFANQSYEALYGHPTAGDITKIQAEDVPDHDILVGGFPCQAFSVAGKRLGFDDTRGTLFFEALRIAKEKRPKALLLENVKGLISHDKGRTLDVMTTALCEIGYTIDFDVLNSKYFGVPQNRERIFIIAVRDDLVSQQSWNIVGTNVVAKGKRRISEIEGVKTFNFDWSEQTEVTTRLRDILEPSVDERYYLSEEKTAKLVSQLSSREDLRQIGYIEKNMQGNRVYDVDGVGTTLASQTGGLGGKGVTLFNEPNMLGHIDLKGHDAIKRVYDPAAIAPTLTTMGGGHREPKIAEEIRSCSTRTRAYAGKPEALEVRKDFVSNTITSVTKDAYVLKTPKYRIRKLTPLECWRLQGFTDAQHQTVVDAGLSDSQRYKQAGNAVTVNVITAIAERIIPYLNEK